MIVAVDCAGAFLNETLTDRFKKNIQRTKQQGRCAKMMRVAGCIAMFVGGAVACYLLISLGVIDKVDGIPGSQQEPAVAIPTYLSFVSVMLTAVTVILTAMAIFIGIVAAYTFHELSEKAMSAAEKRVSEALSDEIITSRIDAVAFRYMKTQTAGELEEGFDLTDSGER